jgi:REP element-mobilizing transposase RayT
MIMADLYGIIVTIITHQNKWLFGDVVDGIMRLNKLGEIVQNELLKTLLIRKHVSLGEFIIMPNYVHALIKIKYKIKNSSGVLQYTTTINQNSNTPEPFHSLSHTLGSIIRGFKCAATKRINILQNTLRQNVWQRNFNDRIIRDKKELIIKKYYIQNNSVKWKKENIAQIIKYL